MPELSKEELKEATKEALHEWLEEKWSAFGRWSLHGIVALLLTACTTFILWTHGGKIL